MTLQYMNKYMQPTAVANPMGCWWEGNGQVGHWDNVEFIKNLSAGFGITLGVTAFVTVSHQVRMHLAASRDSAETMLEAKDEVPKEEQNPVAIKSVPSDAAVVKVGGTNVGHANKPSTEHQDEVISGL